MSTGPSLSLATYRREETGAHQHFYGRIGLWIFCPLYVIISRSLLLTEARARICKLLRSTDIIPWNRFRHPCVSRASIFKRLCRPGIDSKE